MMAELIYKILPRGEWDNALAEGVFHGSGIDLKDGYIHFSDANQVQETARLHFAGKTNLVLVSVDPKLVSAEIKWEASRNGNLFPHLYGPLNLDSVKSVDELQVADSGEHLFPDFN